MEFCAEIAAKNGLRGEMDWLDEVVHFHCLFLSFSKWESDWIFWEFKRVETGGPSIVVLVCAWHGSLLLNDCDTTLLGEEEKMEQVLKDSRIKLQIMELFTCGIDLLFEFTSVGRNC